MSELTLPNIRLALLAQARRIFPPSPDRPLACVAMVLAGPSAAPQVCFIRRADRAGDPWSGHMAFPGGRADPSDVSAQAVAEREVAEEVGLTLDPKHLIAPLTELPVRARGRDLTMRLAAFVYWLEGPPPPLSPQTEEVAEALWVPLRLVYDPANRVRYLLTRNGSAQEFPGVSLGGHVVWGLTYRVLAELGDRVGRPLPAE
jgi:8-oxo-dGTP pyrophosphatase MutT (NUDIX family)